MKAIPVFLQRYLVCANFPFLCTAFESQPVVVSSQLFILNDVRRDHATFHEFEVEGTTYTPSGDM